MEKLPNELVDRIVDFLHDDAGALRACSLTCRIWFPAARYHLLQRVLLKSESQLSTLYNSHVPFIQVRYLHIMPGLHDSSAVFTVSCWPKFENLKELRLTDLSSLVPNDLCSFFSSFPKLEIISIRNSEFRSLDSLLRALYAVPNLSDLSLYTVDWLQSGRLRQDRVCGSWKVRNLSLSNILFDHFAKHLLETYPVMHLRSLSVCPDSYGHLPEFRTFLDSCRDTLSRLDLRRIPFLWTSQINLDLHFLLEEIELPQVVQRSFRYQWSPTILKTIKSQEMKRIALLLQFDPWQRIDTRFNFVRWDEIDNIIEQPQFRGLKCLEVSIQSQSLIMTRTLLEDAQSEIGRLLPKGAARGLLHVLAS